MIRLAIIFSLLVLLLNPFTQAWIAGRLVVDDALAPSDIVVALRGSQEEVGTRVDEAVRLVGKRYAPLLLVDVTTAPVYGVPEAQLFENYVKQKGVAPDQLRRCENDADSTAEEAMAIRACLLRLGVKEVIIVTSEYHTRRARSILQHTFSGLGIVVRFHPVYNLYYWDSHWWRKRRWAKTFFMETVKTAWTTLEQTAASLRSFADHGAPG
jgi:uncharacterized SAM-binding protein YcdF (DUF218 family)